MITYSTFNREINTKETTVDEIPKIISLPQLIWVNCVGLQNDEIKKMLHEIKNIPDFLIEDCTTRQRPKLDDYGTLISIIFKILKRDRSIKSNQLNLIFDKNHILTIFKEDTEQIDIVTRRIDKHINKIRKLGISYLVYLFLDTFIDSYYPIIDSIDVELQVLERKILKNPSSEIPQKILTLRRENLTLKKFLGPEKEILHALGRDDFKLINSSSMMYFRDTYGDILALTDRIETQREFLATTLEIYLSSISNNLNIILKTLTVLAVIVMIPTLIAGIYGMNLKYLPLADYQYGFHITVFIMFLLIVVALVYFKRERWI